MFKNRLLKKNCELKEEDAKGDWRKVYNEKLKNLNSLPNITQIAKRRQMRCAGHTTCMGKEK